MTYDQYWEQDCELVKYYRKAAQIRQDLKNQHAWLQGMYVYRAIANLSPILHAFAKKGTKAIPYPDQPYDLKTSREKTSKKNKEEKQDEKAKAYFQALAISINKKFQEKGGGVNG